MRLVEQTPADRRRLNLTADRTAALAQWLTEEIEDGLAARAPQEAIWREVLRMYEGISKNPVKNIPIENAPNTEVVLGAIAADALYAQSIDIVYTVSPILTARPVPGARGRSRVKHAKAIQNWVNWVAANEAGMRDASEESFLDNIQLGTGVYYIPFVESTKKTDVHVVLNRGPRIVAVPPEDFLVPGGARGNLQLAPWVDMRTYLTEGEFALRAKLRGWRTDGVTPVGNVGWVRSQRETLGRTSSANLVSALYEIHNVYCYYDIDGDGLDEDLRVVWDRSSRQVLKLGYNPYDTRPFEAMRYQRRAHLFYGLGVIEMIRPFEEEATEVHNHRVLNMMLANARIWAGPPGTLDETTAIWPGKKLTLPDPDKLKAIAMADVYPSSAQAEAIVISLAERRVGINELSLPRPSQVLGARTPGITALTLLQQVNRRFTPAFDGMRLATAGAVRQCMYRYQERLLAGDRQVEEHIQRVLGDEDAALVVEVLRDPNFDEAVSIELTASSASVNRDADRQNAIMLMNILGSYYERTLQLVTIAANPQVPEPVRDTARKIANAAGEIVDRTIRSFEMVRDPSAFIVNVEEELDAIQNLSQSGLAGLGQLLQGLAAGDGQPALPSGAA